MLTNATPDADMPKNYLGELEQMVLLAVLRLGEEASAVAVMTSLRRDGAKAKTLTLDTPEPEAKEDARARGVRRARRARPAPARKARAAQDALPRLGTIADEPLRAKKKAEKPAASQPTLAKGAAASRPTRAGEWFGASRQNVQAQFLFVVRVGAKTPATQPAEPTKPAK